VARSHVVCQAAISRSSKARGGYGGVGWECRKFLQGQERLWVH